MFVFAPDGKRVLFESAKDEGSRRFMLKDFDNDERNRS